MTPHGFEVSGAVNSPADTRDFTDEHVRGVIAGSSIPVHKDTNVPPQPVVPVLYQGKIPACIPHSRTWGFHYRYFLANGIQLSLSPRMGYALDKAVDGVPLAEGTYPRIDLQQFKALGECTTTDFPNDVTLPLATYQDAKLIPADASGAALRYNNINYISVGVNVDSIKAAVDDWVVVFACVDIDAAWWTSPAGVTSWDAKDVLPVRPPTNSTGRHQIAIYGYDHQYYYFANSFGDAWGNNGFGTMPIASYMPHFAECWSIEALPQDVVEGIKVVIQQTQPNTPPATLSLLQRFISWLMGGPKP